MKSPVASRASEVWLTGIRGYPRARFRVRGVAVEDLIDAVAQQQAEIPPEQLAGLTARSAARVRHRATAEALLEAVLVDWQGVVIKGEVVPITAALDALTRDAKLRAAVIYAGRAANNPDYRGHVAAGTA